MPFTYQNTYALFSLKSRLYQDAFIALAVWRQIISSVHYTVCSIVHSESKKSFWLKQDPNLGQLELPQVDAKTTEPLSYFWNLLVF